MAYPRETGIRVSASFPAVSERTPWDWHSSNPALPLRGLTRERLSTLDARSHVALSACYGPLEPFGRRCADGFTRLLPAGSGHSRQDQTNLGHGAPRRSDDTEAIGSSKHSPVDGDKQTVSHGAARLLAGCFGRVRRDDWLIIPFSGRRTIEQSCPGPSGLPVTDEAKGNRACRRSGGRTTSGKLAPRDPCGMVKATLLEVEPRSGSNPPRHKAG